MQKLKSIICSNGYVERDKSQNNRISKYNIMEQKTYNCKQAWVGNVTKY